MDEEQIPADRKPEPRYNIMSYDVSFPGLAWPDPFSFIHLFPIPIPNT